MKVESSFFAKGFHILQEVRSPGSGVRVSYARQRGVIFLLMDWLTDLGNQVVVFDNERTHSWVELEELVNRRGGSILSFVIYSRGGRRMLTEDL